MPTSGEHLPEKKQNALVEAFQIIDYDLGILSPAEYEFLKNSKLGIPDKWICDLEEKVVPQELPDGKKAVIIILPNLEKGSDEIPADLLEHAAKLFKKHKESSDLVIAMSSWGYFREKKFLGSPEITEDCPDILLGSGDGPGMTGSLVAQGRTLWVRSYPTGKAVNRIDVMQYPVRDPGFKWTSGESIRWFLQTLTDKTREDPKIATLLTGIVDDK
ncbi:hypothetical protein N7E73_00345 [Maridesulfovibrio sp. FT414]